MNEMGIGVQQDQVVVSFGVCHSGWISMSRENALAFAKEIERQAESIPVTVVTTTYGGSEVD